jgi:hypothetical protein
MSVFGMMDGVAKLTLEFPDGRVYEMDAIATDINYSCDVLFDGVRGREEVEIICRGAGAMISRNEYVEEIKAKRVSSEWECSFCHRPNQRSDEICKSCGAVRPFIYE